MAFHAADKVDVSTWHRARMERDLSNKKIYRGEEMPGSGAGSELNRKLRDEARRKKDGIMPKAFKAEDQPWLLKVNGKRGPRFKGVKKGGVTEHASYYIFTQCPDGSFEAFPVHDWYGFTPLAQHRTLTAEEAEEEWERRNTVLNHFSIMQQRRWKELEHDGDEEEHKEKKSRKKSRELRIHDLEDDLEGSSDDSSGSGEEGGKVSKCKKKTASSRSGKKKMKKKKKFRGSDDEAFEDSDDGDFESQEVDYMSDASSSSQEDVGGKPKVAQQEEEGPRGIDEESESSEESEEEKPAEEEEDAKAPVPQEKQRRKGEGDSSEESDTSEESDIDNEVSSVLLLTKKKMPPTRERKASGSSSSGDSRPSTPSVGSGCTSSTLRPAASKLQQGKRQVGPRDMPAAKRLRLDARSQSVSGKCTPQPQAGKSTPSSGDVQLTEDAVRRYLTRKPMTTKDLLKKFHTKKMGLSSEQTVNMLAHILMRLNPERKVINGNMHFSLKE